jgi:Flp pilus assembly protein TadB
MSKRDGAAVVGVGVAACAVCCAGPILAFLGAIGLGTVLGVAVFGVVGLVVALLAVPVVLRRRRRRRCSDPAAPVPVAAPKMRVR